MSERQIFEHVEYDELSLISPGYGRIIVNALHDAYQERLRQL